MGWFGSFDETESLSASSLCFSLLFLLLLYFSLFSVFYSSCFSNRLNGLVCWAGWCGCLWIWWPPKRCSAQEQLTFIEYLTILALHTMIVPERNTKITLHLSMGAPLTDWKHVENTMGRPQPMLLETRTNRPESVGQYIKMGNYFLFFFLSSSFKCYFIASCATHVTNVRKLEMVANRSHLQIRWTYLCEAFFFLWYC